LGLVLLLCVVYGYTTQRWIREADMDDNITITDKIAALQKDTELGYEKWYEIHGDELRITYYEEGANYDIDYEDWLEARYNKYVNEQTAILEKLCEILE
jgi:hypothetical protein